MIAFASGVLAACGTPAPAPVVPPGPENTPESAYRSYTDARNRFLKSPLLGWDGVIGEQAVDSEFAAAAVEEWHWARDNEVVLTSGGYEVLSVAVLNQDATTATMQTCLTNASVVLTRNGIPLERLHPEQSPKYTGTATTRLIGTKWKVADVHTKRGEC